MNQGTREQARGWALASVIAVAAIALFATAIVVGNPSSSGAAAVTPEVAEWEPPELPREWRWEREAITFDHMFRQLR